MKFLRALRMLLSLSLVALSAPLWAQQTGSISGKVTDTSGGVLPGVTVEARSEVLPGPRVTTTGGGGDFRLPALPPGEYVVTFTLSGMQATSRKAHVQLSQDTVLSPILGVQSLQENVTVTATTTTTLVDKESATISSSISTAEISSLPVGQEYRDLQKLMPGVQYTQDMVRGPSAGGSGQDNVYQFDGVNVNLPLFGTLSAEPSSHDIAQVTVIKGGARAIDFNRSGGFLVDSVSKSGTSRFSGLVSYQLQSDAMAADRKVSTVAPSQFEEDRSWLTASIGGPIVKDRLYFYGSYYRPERGRENAANAYGALPDYKSTRNEGFGKLTFTPSHSLLFNLSYRDSKRTETGALFASNSAPTSGTGSESIQRIATFEGSWVINSRSFATANYTHYANPTSGTPDNVASVTPTSALGARLNIASLDTQGRLTVPVPVANNPAFNAFVQPLIDRYGYLQNGVRLGGGIVGYGSEFNDQDFYRDAAQLGYNLTVGKHDIHIGYERSKESEELLRSSNGWGIITVPGGRVAAVSGQLPYYTARYQAQTTGAAFPIISKFESQSFEINDMIKWNDWVFNLGVLASNDTLYGQGLREDSSKLSGYVSAPGNRYKMYEVPFKKMIQPRLGATWSYNPKGTLYASYAKYNPAASSLPRAASWDRALTGLFVDAHFDQNGVLFAAVPVGSSSGKLFVQDLTPRTVNEFLVGTSRQVNDNLSLRLYGRHRRGSHFWEDTNNNARQAFNPPASVHGVAVPKDLYIPDLSARLAQIGSGSSYVIAELDGAYTRYNEATLEAEWRGRNTMVRGSYTWSEYYGNFDQDNSTVGNDANIFIGSSNIADGAGRQLWDFKDGTLRGDRPHSLKLFGTRQFSWNGSVGIFGVLQSGQPWEEWSFEPYRALTTSTSETNRYAEKAGSRRSDTHYQLDLNYTQTIKLKDRIRLQLVADVYNLFDKQTGYNINPNRSAGTQFGVPRSYYDPRRLQLTARLSF